MAIRPSDSFLILCQDHRILNDAQITELDTWARANAVDTEAVINELRQRGWLSDFQITELREGRGAELHLGRYILLDILGEGGMGRVYRARNSRMGRDVAIKIIRRERLANPTALIRFQQEIQAISQLSHPNIVLALDAGDADGTHYCAMEYVEGNTLAELVRRLGPVPIAVGCEYIRQTAVGLQNVYEQGMVHRDIKPSNLLVTPRGQVKILDLGLAMLNANLNTEEWSRVTDDGLVVGTPNFLAPEQARTPLKVDIRADIYSLGTTLFYLLTGKPPFDGPTANDKLLQHLKAPIPSVRTFRPEVPTSLDALVQWMMAKAPEERPQQPYEVAAALTPFCPTGQAPQQPTTEQAAPFNEPVYDEEPTLGEPQFQAFETPRNEERAQPRQPRERSKPSGGSIIPYLMAFFGCLIVAGVVSLGYYFYTKETRSVDRGDGPSQATFKNAAGITMVRIKEGSFAMGSADNSTGHQADEGPVREVTVSEFYISQHEITHQQYLKVMPSKSKAVNATRMKNGGLVPEDSVTWNDAVAFCKKLNELDVELRAGWTYRLPTEAEWEYACRAGTTTNFNTGDVLIHQKDSIFDLEQDLENDTKLGEGDPTMGMVEKLILPRTVGTYPKSSNGLYDMHGNVWEWTNDYYHPNYNNLSTDNPTGPETGFEHVIRGGSYMTSAADCRSASRQGMASDERRRDVGFRVVLAPAKAE